MSDLFTAAAEQHLRSHAPLAARLRPRTLDDVVGQEHLVGPGKPLRRLVEQDRLTSAIFWGPPGTGKTTLALAVAGSTKRVFEQMSAVNAGIKDVRDVIERARQRIGEHGRGTILFLDEIHRFNKAQQDGLLPAVEDGTLTMIGATTENPFFEVNPPLRSRSTLFRLEPLNRDAIETLVRRGLEAEGTTASPDAIEHLVDRAGGDGRQVLTALEVACALADPGPVELAHVEAALGTSALRYGRDDHYDVISAFIKSMRGSDPQAAVYYLARMLEAGEDARFIARRMIIFASEDIGMADPQALARGGRGGAGPRARRPARGAAQPQPGGHPPGDSPEEQSIGAGHLERTQRRAEWGHRRGAAAPARRALQGCSIAGPRGRLRLPS